MSPTRPRRALALAAALAALVPGCSSGPETPVDSAPRKPARTWPADPVAEQHRLEGERLFAAAEGSPDPHATYVKALAEFAAAAARVPSPDNRFRQACTQLLVRDPDSKERLEPDPETTLDEILTEDPDHAPVLALRAFLDASAADPHEDAAAERAERACAVAALSSDRAVRVFVGDRAADIAAFVQRKKPERAVALMSKACELGSPFATINMGLLAWTGRGAKIDRDKALELGKKAADATFTPEERARGLLHDEPRASRLAARAVGHWLILEASFDEARPYLVRGVSDPDDATVPGGAEPNGQFLAATVELGALEGLGLGGAKDLVHARERLDAAAKAGHGVALELLGRLAAEAHEDERARLLFGEAARTGSLAAFGATGEWEKLALEARDRSTRAKPSPEKLYELRTALFALAVQKGAAARAEAEEAARAGAEGAPVNEPSARQLRHVAGDITGEDLQATMPRSALLPRWRAETELALATRCLLLDERAKALEHLQACRDARAITQPEDALAWAALRQLRASEAQK